MDVSGTKPLGRTLAIAGAWMQAGWVLGLLVMVAGMMSAFHSLGQSGIGDPRVLAASISTVLIAGLIAMIIPLAGLVMLAISIFAFGYRAPWLFWFLIFDSVLMLCGHWVGIALGVATLVFVILKRDEFLGGPAQQAG
jgi:hypothetical protein